MTCRAAKLIERLQQLGLRTPHARARETGLTTDSSRPFSATTSYDPSNAVVGSTHRAATSVPSQRLPASATPLWRRGAAGTSRPSTHAHTHAHTSSPGRPRAAGSAGARAATTGIRTGAPESTPEIGGAGAHTAAPGDVPPAAELARAERSWRRSKGFRGRQLPGGQTAQIAGAAAFGGAAPLRSIATHPSPSTHTT